MRLRRCEWQSALESGCAAWGAAAVQPLPPPTHAPPPRAGVPMVPISWQEMQCPQTQAVENRKVAKLEQ